MSSATLKRALIVLAVLIAIWAGFALFRGGLSDRSPDIGLPKLTAADVDNISITAPDDTIRLVRSGAGWTVNGFPAVSDMVSELIGAVGDTGTSGELIARSESAHARLGVDSAVGRRVQFRHGENVVLDLVVGKRGRSYQTAYVRRAADVPVYLLRGPLASLVDRGADGWRDRHLGGVRADSVATVEITRGASRSTLRRTPQGWRLGSAAADSAAVARFLGSLADVTASGFPTAAQADSLDFRRPHRTLTVLGLHGDTLLALAFDSTASGVWVQLKRGVTARLDPWRLVSLTPSDSTLRSH